MPKTTVKSSKKPITRFSKNLAQNHQHYLSHAILAHKMEADSTKYSREPLFRRSKKLNLSQEMRQRLMPYETNPNFFDPRRPTFFRHDDGSGIYFNPPKLTKNIGRVFAQGKLVRQYIDNINKTDSCIDIHVFGEGYVAYNRKSKEITVVFKGISLDSPSPLTEVESAGELVKNEELSPNGMFQSDYAQAYLSSRSSLIQILQTIRSSDPQAIPQLITTGHGLGGALANLMFIDANVGTLGKKLSEVIKDEQFVTQLLQGTNCYCTASPPVCDEDAILHLTANAKGVGDRFYHAYHENDPMINGINTLKMLRKQPHPKSPLTHIPSRKTLNLGRFEKGYQNTLGWDSDAHAPDILHEELQKAQGLTTIERCWLPVDENLQLTHAAKGVPATALNPEQAANIAEQFDHEFYFSLAKIMAQHEAQLKAKTTIPLVTPLIGYLATVTDIFDKLSPQKNTANLDIFKTKLVDVVKKLRDSSTNNGVSDPQDNVAKIVETCSQLYNVYNSLSGTFSGIASSLVELKIAKYELMAIGGVEAIGLALDLLGRALTALASCLNLFIEETNFLYLRDLRDKAGEQLNKLSPYLVKFTQCLIKIKEGITSFKQALLTIYNLIKQCNEGIIGKTPLAPILACLSTLILTLSMLVSKIETYTDKSIKTLEKLDNSLKTFSQQQAQPSQVSAKQVEDAQQGVDDAYEQVEKNTATLKSGFTRVKEKLFAIGSELVSGIKSDVGEHLHSAVQGATTVVFSHIDRHLEKLSKLQSSISMAGTTVQQNLHRVLGVVSDATSNATPEALQTVAKQRKNSESTAPLLPDLSSRLAFGAQTIDL